MSEVVESLLPVVGRQDTRELTPRQIVEALNKHIIGQEEAKKAVAIAMRNRWRRRQLPDHLRDEVAPKNILMIGPTGVGKTEIARRLAGLSDAPFIKVEATKFTEVGYHGRDVDSMIRDLVKVAISQAQTAARRKVEKKAKDRATERLLEVLLPPPSFYREAEIDEEAFPEELGEEDRQRLRRYRRNRHKLALRLERGELDQREVEIEVEATAEPIAHVFSAMGSEEMGIEFQEALEKMLPRRVRSHKVTVAEARRVFESEEAEKLVDSEEITRWALENAQNLGIVFIDELDKVVSSHRRDGPDVSREGVQRDLLPLVEGSQIMTRWGMVRTDHILFIAAGAFHATKPADLLPELQGRFPIRVELNDLTEEDFVRILTLPDNALIKQYEALLATEGVTVKFTEDAVRTLAKMAATANRTSQNIGARRLHTVIEKVTEDISFEAPEKRGAILTVDQKYVEEKLRRVIEDEDLTRYIL